MWRSIRRCFNNLTGRLPRTSTQVSLDRISDIKFGDNIAWPLTPTMEDVALKSDDPKVKLSAIANYSYYAPTTGADKVVKIALDSKIQKFSSLLLI